MIAFLPRMCPTHVRDRALPFKDYLNFAVGAAIQEYAPIKEILSVRPNEEAIKAAFEGRTRCPASYCIPISGSTPRRADCPSTASHPVEPHAGTDEGWTVESCPAVNTADGPPFPPGREPGLASACDPSSSSQHVPTDFGLEPYVPPYMMDDPMPDRVRRSPAVGAGWLATRALTPRHHPGVPTGHLEL